MRGFCFVQIAAGFPVGRHFGAKHIVSMGTFDDDLLLSSFILQRLNSNFDPDATTLILSYVISLRCPPSSPLVRPRLVPQNII